MGTLTINTFLTLDGVMQSPGAPTEDPSGGFKHGGWLVPYADPDMGRYITEAFASIDALLLGRKTYEIFAAHWPRVTDPSDPIAVALNKMPKYVVSRTLEKVEWHNSHLIKEDVVNEVAKLKRGMGGRSVFREAPSWPKRSLRTTSSTSTVCGSTRSSWAWESACSGLEPCPRR